MLIGNKCDLESQRQISKADATTFAKDNGIVNYHIGIAFMETSAKTAVNVQIAFEKIIHTIYDNVTVDAVDEMKSGKEISKGKKIGEKQGQKGVKLSTEKATNKAEKKCC